MTVITGGNINLRYNYIGGNEDTIFTIDFKFFVYM